MTQYIHRITLAVPESLIDVANQLALVMGESENDVNTFTSANWQDSGGNKFAVCSAVAKPIVLNALSSGLPNPLPIHAENADVTMAQQALDSIVVYDPESETHPSDKIVLAIDHEPLSVFTDLGLSPIEVEI